MSSSFQNFWHDGLRIVSYCPLCESEFNPMEARVLDEDGETHLLHVRCKNCANAMLALVLVTKAGVSSVGLVTDLSYEDVVQFRSSAKVSVDDVLSIHGILEQGKLEKIIGN
ncbi:MAG: hypothetical protein AAB865_00815 [Patescibacteria group bacterium]